MRCKSPENQRRGFTLIELLLAIVIIGLLSAIVIVAVNPYYMFLKAYDSSRTHDAKQIANALEQRLIDGEELDNKISSTQEWHVCQKGVSRPDCVELDDDLANVYLVEVPQDPIDSCNTGFKVRLNGDKIQVYSINQGKQVNDVLAGCLVANWRFEESAGTLTHDSSGAGHTGTFCGGAAWSSDAAPVNYENNSSILFNGSNAFVEMPDPIDGLLEEMAGLTLSAWIKSTNVNNTQQIAAKLNGAACGGCPSVFSWYIVNPGALRLYVNQVFPVFVDSNPGVLFNNTWQHVAATYDGSRIEHYVDGSHVGGGVYAYGDVVNLADTVRIGTSSANEWFGGNIDEFRIYSTVLSTEDIARLASGNGKCTNCTATPNPNFTPVCTAP